MKYVFYYTFPSPIGRLGIAADARGLTDVFFARGEEAPPFEDAVCMETPVIRWTYEQLSEYFSGKRTFFDLPLAPKGTPFQRRVWTALCTVPYGETCSYKEIAEQIGSPDGSQAVGQANSHNPIPFIIPCHRVVAADGSLGGYSLGPDLKKWLLDLERSRG